MGKRKRSHSAAISSAGSSQSFTDLLEQSINPFSYAPSTLTQLVVAGLSDKDQLPSHSVKDFPHRPAPEHTSNDGWRSSSLTLELDLDEEGEDGHDKRRDKQKPPQSKALGGHLGPLVAATRRFLERGDIEKAAKTFSLITNRSTIGAKADLRHHGLWAIGLEIIMREGEKPVIFDDHQHDSDEDSDRGSRGDKEEDRIVPRRRWGSTANLQKAKTYLTTLIHKHPYDHRQKSRVAAPDFWMAMFSCEIYVAHSEYVSAIEDLNKRPDGSNSGDEDKTSDDEGDGEGKGEGKGDAIRLRTLAMMRDVVQRMDDLNQNQPYARMAEMWRLRAMASLFIADLLAPQADNEDGVQRHNLDAARRQQDQARGYLQKMVDSGSGLDAITRRLLDPDGELEDESPGRVYASLPIRQASWEQI